jgi:hypothetical protein
MVHSDDATGAPSKSSRPRRRSRADEYPLLPPLPSQLDRWLGSYWLRSCPASGGARSRSGWPDRLHTEWPAGVPLSQPVPGCSRPPGESLS